MATIFILTEGGGKIGMGHISRCLSLYQAFSEYGHTVQMIVNREGAVSNALDGINHIHIDWINEKERLFSILQSTDILLIDSYLCPEDLYQKLALLSSVTAYIDDDQRITYPEGIIINGVMCAEKLAYPFKNGVTYLLGEAYSFLRKEFWKVPDKVINTEVKSIMITCGGNDLDGLSYRILRSLAEAYPAVEKKVIIKGPDTPYLEYYREHSTVCYNLSASEMREVMISSDIAVTASGQTTYELCRIGTPFIPIITAQNQTFSINCFHEKGLVGQGIVADDPGMGKKILDQFSTLQAYQTRRTISDKMKTTISGKGSLKIVRHLLQTLEKNNQQ